MRENEFEKQLKHLMEDFHIPPSDAVWDKVSRKLNEKNRRKTPFIFLLAVGLLITGYLVFQSSEKQLQHSDGIAGNKASKPIKTDSISLRDSNNVFVQKTDITKTAD